MTLSRRKFSAGLSASIALPSLVGSVNAQSATMKIGMCSPVTGPAAESGKYAQIGARIALDAINKAGGVLGKQVELIVEDDQTTNPGIVLAFSKLASQTDIVAFLGSIRSTQVHAMAPDVLKVGKPVMIGGTDPALTHMGNQWLFRFRPNDSYSGSVLAEFGVKTLGKKKWAIVHSTDAFGTAGGKALTASLGKLEGATVALDQGYANQSQDFTPVVLAIKQSGADILGSYFTFENDLGVFARQLRQLGVNDSLRRLAVDRQHHGAQARRARAVRHLRRCRLRRRLERRRRRRSASSIATPPRWRPTTSRRGPTTPMTVLCMAINKAGKTDPTAIREAILADEEARRAPKANTTSTPTATACTATTS